MSRNPRRLESSTVDRYRSDDRYKSSSASASSSSNRRRDRRYYNDEIDVDKRRERSRKLSPSPPPPSSRRDSDRKNRRRRSRTRSRSRSRDRRRNSSRRKSRSNSNERLRHSGRTRSRSTERTRVKKSLISEPESPSTPPAPQITLTKDIRYPVDVKVEKEDSPSPTPSPRTSHDYDICNITLPKQRETDYTIKAEPEFSYLHLDSPDEEEKEKIHKEMQERLRKHLASEGKVYPAPKPQASHPIFANDGSFLETFKRMQEHQQHYMSNAAPVSAVNASVPIIKQEPDAIINNHITQPPVVLPVFGKRRGGKILKTGLVEKPKPIQDHEGEVKDAWSIYMQEVKKYKNTACDINEKSRPLLK